MLRDNNMADFDNDEPEEIEDKNIDDFMDGILKLCKKHNLSIAHEDCGGAFLIEKYKEHNIRWFNAASINFNKAE